MLLDNLRITRFSELPEDTYNFFKKVAGYDTLRMILCKKTILCEGDSDELVIQKAYMQLNDGRLPIEDGIEVISVGVSFLRFLEIADCIQTKIAVVTDNDGDMAAIQDLAGYDLDIIKSLLQAECDVTMVGDPRQVTYHTHNEAKYKKYANGKIEEFIKTECKKPGCIIDKETLNDSYRNNQSICSYSSQLYEEYGETGTKQFAVTGHDGVFLVRPDDVDAYLEEFKPMQLREKRTVKVNDRYAVINMGEAKGLTYDRVLIYPTGTMRSWMKDHSKTLQPKTKSQFYVAITRARYSVGIVFDYDEKISIEGVEKYQ